MYLNSGKQIVNKNIPEDRVQSILTFLGTVLDVVHPASGFFINQKL